MSEDKHTNTDTTKNDESTIKDQQENWHPADSPKKESIIRKLTTVTEYSRRRRLRIAKRSKHNLKVAVESMLKPQNYQVCITIIEGWELHGSNLNPFVCVQVGEKKINTSHKAQTNYPYFNEYFVFDFYVPLIALFDKVITLTVLHSKNILQSSKIIGTFKIDVKTVYDTPDHQFYHKWVVLTDAKDIDGAVKGYLKCDISVIGKGDTVKIPSKIEKDDDDIEGNLLLPKGVPIFRTNAHFIVYIYRAEGLRNINTKFMSNVKHVLTCENKEIKNPYVQVSFAGMKGKTSVKKFNSEIIWNEKIIFTERFPPLCQRLKIQLRDNVYLRSSVIATTYIELRNISNEGEKGFLPTFGPSFIYLYGFTYNFDQNSKLNREHGGGTSYRGRLLIAIQTVILNVDNTIPFQVHVVPTDPIDERLFIKNEEFFLFATIFNASMIHKKLGHKSMNFELNIGNSENKILKAEINNENGNNDIIESIMAESSSWQSTTIPIKPKTHDKHYYYLPFGEYKPCMHICSVWNDSSRKMYNSNIILKIVEKLEHDLDEVSLFTENEADMKLRTILEDLSVKCNIYTVLAKPSKEKIDLDKEYFKLCLREIENIRDSAKNLVEMGYETSFSVRYNTAKSYLNTLKSLTNNITDTLPDIFLWVLNGKKMITYERISATDIIYSAIDEECGKYCGKTQTLLLNFSDKKHADWNMSVKLEIYLWLGLAKYKRNFKNNIPAGYEIIHAKTDRSHFFLHYIKKSTFQLRAYIYQARSLIGDDVSGLSNPFARVIAGEYSRTTHIINETLTPTWNESLIFENIIIHGKIDEIDFSVIIEIFDYNRIGESQLLGRAIAKPKSKRKDEPYDFPTLDWLQIFRGAEYAGELLAAFELLEIPELAEFNLPLLPKPIHKNHNNESFIPIPIEIRPKLVPYRIEILFWGLRHLKRIHGLNIDKPRIEIECADNILYSSIINNMKKNGNFEESIKFLEVDLPEEVIYQPGLTIRLVDCWSFGRCVLVGVHIVRSIQKYKFIPMAKNNAESEEIKELLKGYSTLLDSISYPKDTSITLDYGTRISIASEAGKTTKKDKNEEQEIFDWWTKYFASTGRSEDKNQPYHNYFTSDIKTKALPKNKWQKVRQFFTFEKKKPEILKVQIIKVELPKVIRTELENVPKFEQFKEWLQTFELYRGKKVSKDSEDDDHIIGYFKGAMKVYKMPLEEQIFEFDTKLGYFHETPKNNPIQLLVRVYIIGAYSLHPQDISRKTNPYLILHLGNITINEQKNCVTNDINPVFGKCFEIEAEFPRDTLLTIQIWNWDVVNLDYFIGETKIDLENRFYSKHRATCGLSKTYKEHGYNKWRDSLTPSEILAKLCKEAKVSDPIYAHNHVIIGNHMFDVQFPKDSNNPQEVLALEVLNRWHEFPEVGCHLVPEHIETRSLYNSEKPGMEQGKLEMWIDMFSCNLPMPPPPINISPRKPSSYELRVIIWNTADVILKNDFFFTGEKMADIYVKGWIQGIRDYQHTDVHYRSFSGEGNFNWRFIFTFDYMTPEQKIVISRKESIFTKDRTQYKIPAFLELQVWDADHFTPDDFLGAITLDLNRFPRGAKSSAQCSLKMLKTDDTVPYINIFKLKRTRGWWPVVAKEKKEMVLTGKIEMEMHLLTKEEAEKNPAGKGRSEPDALEKPLRLSKKLWFLDPLKTLCYIWCRRHKCLICKITLLIASIIFIVLFIYSIPNHIAKKLIRI